MRESRWFHGMRRVGILVLRACSNGSRPTIGSRNTTRLGVALALAIGLAAAPIQAADPPSGTLSATNTTVTWTGAFLTPTGGACGGPDNAACDNFLLNIIPPSYSFEVRVTLVPQGDWDLELYGPEGQSRGGSGNPPSQTEVATIPNPPAGTYTVVAVPFAPAPLIPSYTASATIVQIPDPQPGSEPVTYINYEPPAPLGRDAAEPSIGVNWKTDKVMYIAGLETLRLGLDDCSSPARETWDDVSHTLTSQTTLDPILFTDRFTGRTFVSQLSGTNSLMAYTDDDGTSWIPTEGGPGTSGVDHQTVGGGPFHTPLTRDPQGPIYPNAVYYCSQDLADALCSRSDDGGASFGPTVPIYTIVDCGGIHGHAKVAPDGTVYIPNMDCGQQAVVVSEDNGLTWSIRRIPGSSPPPHITDPSVGITTDGTIYFGYSNGGTPKIAVSHDRGLTWVNITDLGPLVGVVNSTFPAVVAGDPNRAAMAFLGSSTPGDGTGADPTYAGVWYLYVAHTYDGGQTWTVVNATPGDPVQRGTICNAGTLDCTCCRNLLDFNDASIDRLGRVVIAYADGCGGSCVDGPPNSNTDLAKVARQVNGRRMFSQYDQLDVPAAPLAEGSIDAGNSTVARFTWSTPDDHGSPITGYRLYRRTNTSGYTLRASLPATQHAYNDAINPAESYLYKVTAVNAIGEGPFCGQICISATTCAPPPEDACTLPGLTVLTDAAGDYDSTSGSSQYDILQVWASGIYTADGPNRLVFTMKVDNLSAPPINSAWRTIWTSPDGINYFVDMDTFAAGGAIEFNYGTFDATTGFSVVGPADDGSFSSDGTIEITIATSKVGSPVMNQALTGINARADLLVGGPVGGVVVAVDAAAGPGSYICRDCGQDIAPHAEPDFASTPTDTPIVIDVLGNDSEPQNQPMTVLSVTQPVNGTAANNGDGSVTYTPGSGFVGTDVFTYTVGDPDGNTDVATVTVVVGPCAADPVFAGIQSVSSPGQATCALDLAWSSGAAVCSGESVRYNVYRSTSPAFTPSLSNAIALRVGATSYRDGNNLSSGVTYYYIVRAEDTSAGHGGPGNGGSEDNNLVRLSGVPRGPLVPGSSFSDDMEPATEPGYTISATREPAPQVLPDATAHSTTNSLVLLDDQPGNPSLTYRDDTVVLPVVNLSSTSVMTFWHNFDFARFPTGATATRYRSGSVLEISADGTTWRDLGADANGNLLPYISPNQRRYNGVVSSATNEPQPKPLNGRMAWVGSSDGDNVAGRADNMVQVTVNLGQAIQDFYGATALPGARIRFHLGGTFQALAGGIQGSGWGIDDITLTNLLAPGPCTTPPPPGAGDVPDTSLTVGKASGGNITLSWGSSCLATDTDYEIYEGTVGIYYSHTSRFCSTSGATTMTLSPATASRYYLVVSRNGFREGSYGLRSNGSERPQGSPACIQQDVGACP